MSLLRGSHDRFLIINQKIMVLREYPISVSEVYKNRGLKEREKEGAEVIIWCSRDIAK